jgi:5-methylthioadenosine/S-adenosylhomocysteine deaminase
MVDRDGSADTFLTAYLAGTPEEVPAVPVPRAGAAPPAKATPAETVALHGCVITPTGPRENTWLVIEGGEISELTSRKPSGVPGVRTEGVLLPGLIDLHGHPEFNIFAPWEPPRFFPNRYSWRGSDAYHALVRTPQNTLQDKLPAGTQLRYAEIRALTGGVTAIQGASGLNRATDESLVRNVDLRIFGEHKARAMIDLPDGPDGRGADTLANVLAAIDLGEVNAFYVHLAEGQRDNQRSIDEFANLVDLKALTPATIVIHGSALARDQLGDMRDVGASLVWSPQSNLRLYGETTRASDALDLGLPVALGADWLPSGSTSLLGELKIARQELANQGRREQARSLVDMVTADAADIAGLGDRLGRIEAGRPADVLVLARRDDDAYESVCRATAMDVELVTIGGDLSYGRTDWVEVLAADFSSPALEPVIAWGRPMMLDVSWRANPGEGDTMTTLSQLRADLTRLYPPVGPIWA